MAGYWLNPDTGTLVKVETTHDEWVRIRANAKAIGLTGDVYEAIIQYSPREIDEIRLLALKGGLVRIREHPRYISVQFWTERERLPHVLQAVLVALKTAKARPEGAIQIDNLLTNESVSLGLTELADRLAQGLPVFEKD